MRADALTRSEDSGVVTLSDGMVTFQGEKYRSAFRLKYLREALNGATVMTLLSSDVEANANTILQLGTAWVRAVPTSAK